MPTTLTLVSLKLVDSQDSVFEHIRLRLILDGTPVKFIEWNHPLADAPDIAFSEEDNRTDMGSEFVFWSTADLIVYEADRAGSNVGIDTDTDEWVQTVRLDHPGPAQDEYTVGIGKPKPPAYLGPGRSDTEYRLTYSLAPHRVQAEPSVLEEIRNFDSRSDRLKGSSEGNFAKDKARCKWICSIDGGGLRGIFPLRMLEQLEEYYGVPCFKMFDMFAGTSTGSIISALLATGHPVKDVISFYASDKIRAQLFERNREGQEYALRYFNIGSLGATPASLDDATYLQKLADMIESRQGDVARLIRAVAEQVITPRYQKAGMKRLMAQILSTSSDGRLTPLKMSDCGEKKNRKDILITARDMDRCETTFFSAFHIPHKVPPNDPVKPVLAKRKRVGGDEGKVRLETVDVVTGTYQDALLKDAVEASASAPTYFSPRSQFVDGGVGAHNNPSFMAAVEALRYSHVDTSGKGRTLKPKYTPYKDGIIRSGTVVWSFGTAYHLANRDAQADIASLIGGSLSLAQRTDTALYWVEKVIDNLMFGANQEQDFLCREILKGQIKYLRFNLGLSNETLDDLNVPGGFDQQLSSIGLDAADPESFARMDMVAKAFASHARDSFEFSGNGYQRPDPGNPTVSIESYAADVLNNFKTYE